MKTLTLTKTQMALLDNIIAFRVLTDNPPSRPYDEDTKREMTAVRQQIRLQMGWDIY